MVGYVPSNIHWQVYTFHAVMKVSFAMKNLKKDMHLYFVVIMILKMGPSTKFLYKSMYWLQWVQHKWVGQWIHPCADESQVPAPTPLS